jgi:hypothetical protein
MTLPDGVRPGFGSDGKARYRTERGYRQLVAEIPPRAFEELEIPVVADALFNEIENPTVPYH